MGETRTMSRLENSSSRFQKEKKDSELFSLAYMFEINLGISLVRGSSKFILSVTFRSFPGTKENIPRIHVIIGKVENRKLRVDWRIANSVVFPDPGPGPVQQSCTLTAVSRASNLLQPTYTDPRPRDPHHHSPRLWQSESLSSQGGFVSFLCVFRLSFHLVLCKLEWGKTSHYTQNWEKIQSCWLDEDLEDNKCERFECDQDNFSPKVSLWHPSSQKPTSSSSTCCFPQVWTLWP